MSYLYRKILLYIQMLFFFSSTGVLGTEYIAKTATEHGMMCGCKNIFLVRHFDATGVEITPNATWQTTVTYGGSAGSYSVLTPDAGPYSTFSIPERTFKPVVCILQNR
jgi:hypothetical protein